MAKQLTLPKETAIKAVPYPKGFEKQFENMLVKMTTEASKFYFNNTIKKLNKGTIDKFADAQTGNWATVFNSLDAKAKKALHKRFSKERINAETSRILHALNRTNQSLFYGSIEDRIGVSIPAMIAQEGTGPKMNALIIETQKWVQKNLDDNLAFFANNTLRMMADGSTFDELIEGYDKETVKQVNKSRFIARNQLSSFNGLSKKIRDQKLGIKEAIWQDSRDARVRPMKGKKSSSNHRDRHGKRYELSKGLYSSKDRKWLQVGTDYL